MKRTVSVEFIVDIEAKTQMQIDRVVKELGKDGVHLDWMGGSWRAVARNGAVVRYADMQDQGENI